MTYSIHHHTTNEQDWVEIDGKYEAFSIWPEAEDYVEETSKLMQRTAEKLFTYPFYVHFEGYSDDIEETLSTRDTYEITYQLSGRKVLTMHANKTFNADVPSYTVKIANPETLQNVFSEWFHLASQNMMWLLTQHEALTYKNGYAFTTLEENPKMLIADHDAQGFTFISKAFQTKEDVLNILK